MKPEITVMSCFDGMSGGMLSLRDLPVTVKKYYASEIDKYAIQVSEYHFPEIVRMGDITKWREWDIDWSTIDLLLGGSPCQGFSAAGKQGGTKADVGGETILVTTRDMYLKAKREGAKFHSQSHLFWEFVLLLDHIKVCNPNIKFLLENVQMGKHILEMFDEALGVTSVVINSALVSAQNRVRHYWCNWEVSQPADRGILLRDILETEGYEYDVNKERLKQGILEGVVGTEEGFSEGTSQVDRMVANACGVGGKSKCVTASSYKGMAANGSTNVLGCIQVATAEDINGHDIIRRVYSERGKSPTLTASSGGNQEPKVLVNETMNAQGKSYALTASYDGAVAWNSAERKQRTKVPVKEDDGVHPNIYKGLFYRKLTPLECERLQTVPDNYTLVVDEAGKQLVSDTQRRKMIGNGWTKEVITHILSTVPFSVHKHDEGLSMTTQKKKIFTSVLDKNGAVIEIKTIDEALFAEAVNNLEFSKQLAKYQDIKARRAQVKEYDKQLGACLDKLKANMLDYMTANNMQNVNIEGVGTVYQTKKVRYNVADFSIIATLIVNEVVRCQKENIDITDAFSLLTRGISQTNTRDYLEKLAITSLENHPFPEADDRTKLPHEEQVLERVKELAANYGFSIFEDLDVGVRK